MGRENFITGIAVAILTFCIWAYVNQPQHEPPWPTRIQGFCVSPMRAGQSPLIQKYPSSAEIKSDLSLLAEKALRVRTYAVEYSLGQVARLAAPFNIQVTLGGWVDADEAKTESEIAKLIQLAATQSNVDRVIVGNEVVLRGDVPKSRLVDYLERTRRALAVPVSTAEPWHVWLKHPDLADHVDYLAVHMLPYWEGVHIDAAVDYIVDRMNELKARFPDKPIVIAEAGWPSNGRTRQDAVASASNEAIFLRRFLARAEQEAYIYYLMEAFDQPWKRQTEGAVGAYWGVYDVHREEKFPFRGPIVAIPNWCVLAAVSVLIAGVIFALLLMDSRKLRQRGRNFLALTAYFASAIAVWIVNDYFHQYWTAGTVMVGLLILVGMIGVILVLLTEAHEWVEALWVAERKRPVLPEAQATGAMPFVSIHIPACNEPPQMLLETLAALRRLDYPHFEVLVIDNNTADANKWRPVSDFCDGGDARFKFFHVDPLAGFKAGALNFALGHTRPEAQIVAVIDSDYAVAPRWLADLVPHFENPRVAFVQAPQDYRDNCGGMFKSICYSEYKGFFHIGMVTRNDRNAIIQHGTMTLVRRKMLERIGGWAQWCITEDAELGLRIFEQGYEGIYIQRSYGKGLMPDTFRDYQQQRFRWAYGAIRILRRHAKALFGRSTTKLSRGQRYHFIAGWLPWVADGANLLFNIAALALSAAMIIAPDVADPPLAAVSFLLIVLFVFKICKLHYLYRTRVQASIKEVVLAALAGFALSHTVGKAVLYGFMTRDMPFQRTPKLTAKAAADKMGAIYQEALLAVLFVAAAFGVYMRKIPHNIDLSLWAAVLIIQALPYGAAILMETISFFENHSIGARLLRTLKLKPHSLK